MSKPNFCVVKAAGINCEVESAAAVRAAGGEAEIVHVSQLTEGDRALRDYQGLFIPGGFSAGDAIRAGAVLATQLREGLGDDIREFAADGKPVLGICNGFQVLVEMGLLPGDGANGERTAALTNNLSGKFESRWVNLAVNTDAVSPFVPQDTDSLIRLPIANGEGRFWADPEVIERLHHYGQVLMQYCDSEGQPSQHLEDNPSGAMDAIAAVCNPAGNVMGSMPHIERFTAGLHDINHRRPEAEARPYGLIIMRSIVDYAANV